mgnify:FL=1|tara:strand:+ start:181 stop:723 length:543 start_codon:yes stop_codon:yes gene_type:complete
MENLETRMQKTILDLEKKFSSLKTGRANPDMLNSIQVEYYGSMVPIQQLATISVNEGTQFVLNVFDSNSIKSIEKALMSSTLDLNPQTDGNVIRISLPELTEERRKDLVKVVKQYSEEAKISLRNIRRDALDNNKLQEKNNEITEDDLKKGNSDIQDITNKYSAKIDSLIKTKETEILTV